MNKQESGIRSQESGGRGPLATPKDLLLPYQRKWVDDPARLKIGIWSRQTGKSFSTAEEAVEDCYLHPGAMWVCMSAGERQALEWMEKAKQWTEAFDLAIEESFEDRDGPETLMRAAEVRYGNKSRIVSVPANPSTARGYSCNVILDEFDYHDDQAAIWRAMYPSIANPLKRQLKLRIVSTYNGKRKCFEIMEKGEGWSKHLVTIEDAQTAGLDVDIEALKAGLDDPDAWDQEFMCIPLDGSNVLLPYDLIAGAESAEASEMWAGPGEEIAKTPGIYCGIDFGRQHDPTVCWTLQRVGDVLFTREVLVLAKMDTPDQQQILRSRIGLAERVSFDYTGPGVGLGDLLAKDFGAWEPTKHQFGRVELCTFTVGFKREIFPKLRRLFEPPVKVRIPISRVVREDLHAMQQVLHNGQYDYWAPRTREGHSDRCTALALAVRAAGDGTKSVGIAVR